MISDATKPFFDYGRPNGVDKPNTFRCVISPKTTVGEKLQKRTSCLLFRTPYFKNEGERKERTFGNDLECTSISRHCEGLVASK